jgi:hypothetical protein
MHSQANCFLSADYLGALPKLTINHVVTFQLNCSYRITFHKTTENTYYLNIQIISWNQSLSAKIQEIITKLINERYTLGIFGEFTLFISTMCTTKTNNQITNAVNHAVLLLSQKYPSLNLQSYGSVFTVSLSVQNMTK